MATATATATVAVQDAPVHSVPPSGNPWANWLESDVKFTWVGPQFYIYPVFYKGKWLWPWGQPAPVPLDSWILWDAEAPKPTASASFKTRLAGTRTSTTAIQIRTVPLGPLKAGVGLAETFYSASATSQSEQESPETTINVVGPFPETFRPAETYSSFVGVTTVSTVGLVGDDIPRGSAPNIIAESLAIHSSPTGAGSQAIPTPAKQRPTIVAEGGCQGGLPCGDTGGMQTVPRPAAVQSDRIDHTGVRTAAAEGEGEPSYRGAPGDSAETGQPSPVVLQESGAEKGRGLGWFLALAGLVVGASAAVL
ncbi:hypothetical protein DRE_04181 [Drechslerella stenobrocha 248]|uniref:Uncharacterized protein n=1 Tax=Drechslerella stenobrocha 248 TaxID=1043628 RepID=W7HTI5_9PEZI|nr:hypothetical protein DRE_04181 [Drechslerella stenobrocha 248]